MRYKLTITRFLQGYDWTIGEFRFIDTSLGLPVLNGFCLEPAGEDTTTPNQDKRIPQGRYEAVFEFSPRFKRYLPVLFNEKVSKNRRILIHAGNTGTDTAGCILLGSEWKDGKVLNSKVTVEALFAKLRQEDFVIEIYNGFIR